MYYVPINQNTNMEEINMKTWNTPEVKELDINETAGGFLPADFETTFFFHDKGATTKPDSESGDKTGNDLS